MQRTLSIISALVMSTVVLGCAKAKNEVQAPGAAGPVAIELRSVDSARSADETRAGHGFTVSEDGTYTVGPSATGEVIKGALTPSETAQVKAAIGTFQAVSANALTSGTASAQITSQDTLTLVRGSERKEVIASSREAYAHSLASQEEAEGLHTAIRALADKYAPAKFVGACGATINALHDLQNTLRGCAVDSDCGYVTMDNDVIESGFETWVSYDACSYASPTIVGNINAVFEAKTKLTQGMVDVNAACGGKRDSCVRSQLKTSAAAVCDAGVCRVNSSINY